MPEWDARYNAQDTISAMLPRLDKCARTGGTVRLTQDECRAVLHLVDLLASNDKDDAAPVA